MRSGCECIAHLTLVRSSAHRAGRSTVLGIAMLCALAGGCASQEREKNSPAGRALSLAEFRKEIDPALVEPVDAAPAVLPQSNALSASGRFTPPPVRDLTDPMADVIAVPGDPAGRLRADAVPVGPAIMVDSLVGQINGKPIYVSEFFAASDRRLAADAALAADPRSFIVDLARRVSKELELKTRDELFLAEARSTLTTDQRKGLIAVLTRLRESFTETAQGSAELANERSLVELGKTLEQRALDQRDQLLIGKLLSERIAPRVNVSWRDVQREYNRNFELYNPAAQATLRMIWVNKRDAAKVQQVTDKLGAGESFEAIAKNRDLNIFNAGEGGLLPKRAIPADKTKMVLLDDPTLNDKAKTLSPGEVAGPIDYRERAVWIKLESVEQEPPVTLEQAQLQIASALRSKRIESETQRFYAQLAEVGSMTDSRVMTGRLVEAAAERYLKISDLPAAMRPGPSTQPGATAAPVAPPASPVTAPPAAPNADTKPAPADKK